MKRMCACLLIVMMVLSLSAIAEGFVPSPAVQEPAKVSMAMSAEQQKAIEETAFEMLISEEKQESTIALIENMAAFAATKPICEFFGEEVFREAEKFIPEGVKVEEFKVSEIQEISNVNYDPIIGSLPITFEFATKYDPDAKVLVMVGVEIDGVMTWIPVETEVVDGNLVVTFPAELLEQMKDQKMVLVVLEADDENVTAQ